MPMKKILIPMLLLSAPHLSQAALIASESFSYTSGALGGNGNSGSGFGANTWGANAGATVTASSLAYGSLATSGGSANLSGGNFAVFRNLAASGGGAGSDLWISFLIASPSSNVGVSLFNGAGNEQFFAGRNNTAPTSNNFGAQFYAGTGRPLVTQPDPQVGSVSTPFNPVVGTATTHMYVLQIDQTGPSPVYRGWLDPDMATLGTGSAPTATSTFTINTGTQAFNYDRVRLGIFSGGGSSATFDELRLGTTWADVSPIPEPSSLLLLSVGALGLLRRRR